MSSIWCLEITLISTTEPTLTCTIVFPADRRSLILLHTLYSSVKIERSGNLLYPRVGLYNYTVSLDNSQIYKKMRLSSTRYRTRTSLYNFHVLEKFRCMEPHFVTGYTPPMEAPATASQIFNFPYVDVKHRLFFNSC